jgi:glycosyltransferase involved in cell wall biosynthesis
MGSQPNSAQLAASVAICTYQRYDFLEKAIESTRAQTLAAAKFEVLVIDNSPDPELSSQHGKRYRGIRNLRWIHEKTPGLSNARNVATAAAASPIVAFLDDDAIADDVWLESLLDTYDLLGPSTCSVGGRVRPLWGGERPPWLGDELLSYLSVVDLGEEPRLLEPGEWVAGANVSYRVDALKRAGGFSVSLGRVGTGASLMSNEETDLADRLKAEGGQLAYDPRAAVDHFVDPSRLTQEWFRRRMAWQAVSDYVRSPKDVMANSPRNWVDLKEFFAHCPPLNRTIRGLALPEAEAARFRWQLSAVYNAIISLLSGASEVDDG